MIENRLLELKIELTSTCPLSCIHCSSCGGPKGHEHLLLARILTLIHEFTALGGQRICLSGGEPLSFPGLVSVIDSSANANIEIALYTTGIAVAGGDLKPLSTAMADYLAANGVKVIFSLHGARKHTHNRVTQVMDSFDYTVAAIETAVKAGVQAEIHVVPMSVNFNELVDISKLADSLDVRRVSWLRFVPQGRGMVNGRILQLAAAQLSHLPAMRDQAVSASPRINVRMGAPFNILAPDFPASCEAGRSVLTVRPNGAAYPCDAFKQFHYHDGFGNVLRHSLEEVWTRSTLLTAVRRLQQSELPADCLSCERRSRCRSGCPAQKAIRSGVLIDCRDPGCLLASSEAVGEKVEALTV